jgi:solute carrier family 30 (zinc transporter), member 5/7
LSFTYTAFPCTGEFLLCAANYITFVKFHFRLQPNRVARVGSISVFLSALICTYLWSNATSTVSELEHPSIGVVDHSLSGGSILACILFAIGISVTNCVGAVGKFLIISATLSLTSDSKQSGKGSLIGYSDLGLPLYSFKNSVLHQTSKSFLNLGSAIFKQMLTNPNSRKIFYFLCVNMGIFCFFFCDILMSSI